MDVTTSCPQTMVDWCELVALVLCDIRQIARPILH
jgi:hypothetical protein